MSMFRTLAVSIAALAVVGVTAALAQDPATPPNPGPAPAPAPAAAEPTVAHTTPPSGFEDCAACHGVTKDAPPMIGPSLWGIGGRKAGTGPGYDYSPAMKAHAVTWTPETLQPFLLNPVGTVAGTTMGYQGVADAATAKAIADYLMTLKD